jgi:hypothetical protein
VEQRGIEPLAFVRERQNGVFMDHQKNWPCLSKHRNGFFLLAKKLGFKFDLTEEGKLKFAIEQIQRVSLEQSNNQSGGS